ncbi:hypothetical protein [Homoserinibacter sp. YIM 151385]|uniref:hypothetical protein n=1 Tax=Homoserinibacter sp. YIM 151385 TaxID=2985506 RepID=UPI0022EFDAB7|nr:hypothetical protein [Homoserinibacter sp. YIM 151385]WBU39241.1 hypothetical protein OF852_06600 [Homoserinibacter sp. YIM 151385]
MGPLIGVRDVLVAAGSGVVMASFARVVDPEAGWSLLVLLIGVPAVSLAATASRAARARRGAAVPAAPLPAAPVPPPAERLDVDAIERRLLTPGDVMGWIGAGIVIAAFNNVASPEDVWMSLLLLVASPVLGLTSTAVRAARARRRNEDGRPR